MFRNNRNSQKKEYYSIRKFKFGAASVTVGTALFFLMGGTASANEVVTETANVESKTNEEGSLEASENTAPVAETNKVEVAVKEARTANISYTVKYVDETGKVLDTVSKVETVETTDEVASKIVTVESDVKSDKLIGYKLKSTEDTSKVLVLKEGSENEVVFVVTKEIQSDSETIIDDTNSFVSEKATTKPVVKFKKTKSSAMPRPANEGRSFTEGASFRADTTSTPTVTDPMPSGYTVDTERLPEELQKFSDKSKDIVTFGIVQNDATNTYFSYILNKRTGTYEVIQFNPEGVELTRQTIPNNGTSTNLYFDGGKTRLKAQFRAAEQGSSPLSLSLQTFATAEKAKEENNANPLQSLAGRFSDGYVDKSSGERRFGLIEYYAPLVAYSDTSHTNLLTGTEIHPDVIQSGYTGETYTTRPFNQAGEAGENFDVLAPLNTNGVLTTAAWKEKGQVEDVIIEQPYSRWVNKAQENGTLLRKIRYEIVDDEGNMKISVFYADKPAGYDVKNPENGPEPNFKPAIAIKRETKQDHTYTIGGNKWKVSSYEVEKAEVIVKPSISETGPYTVPFKSEHFTVYEDFVTEGGYPPAEGRVYANNVLNVRNPFRRASDEIKYYYTQETAVVKFFDVTDGGKRDLNEDVTGINGKGESLIPSDQGANATGQSVSDIIAEYQAKGYKVKVNGFDAKPTFNATTAEYPAYGTSEEDMKANEAARRETNKATVEITLEKVKGSVVVNFVDEAGNPIPGADSVNAVTNSPIIDENTSRPNTYDVTAEEKQTITVGEKTYELVPTKNATRQDNGSFSVTDGPVPNSTGTIVEGTTYVNYVYREVPKQQLAKLIFREVPSKEEASKESVLDINKYPYTADQDVTGTAGQPINFENVADAKSKLEAAGYEIVSDDYSREDGTKPEYNDVEGDTQGFKVVVTPRYEDIPPKDTPNWPEGTPEKDKQEKLVERVTRTIHYRYLTPDGEEASADVVETLEFERSARINMVTKEVTYTEWTPKTTTTFTNVTSPIIEGFTADKLEAGEFTNIKATDDDKEVTVIYTPKAPKTGKVVVNYVDEEGNVIKDPVEDTPTSPEGTEYSTLDNKPEEITNPKTNKEYVLVKVKEDSDPEKGTVKKGETNVTYVYKEKPKGNVVVKYIDVDGNEIKDPIEDTQESYVGTDYNTEEDNKPQTIKKEGKVYELVPVLTKGNETGKVVEGTTTVTYVYKDVTPKPEAPKTGTVVIEYVDTKGNPIKTSVVDDKDVPVGTDYDTTDEDGKPSTITVGKDKYVLVPSLTQGTENGKVVEGTTTITYVYQKVANWIPELPGVPDKERPRTPYPFNPEQPKNPIPGIPTNPETGIPVIPYVDGYVPNVPGKTEPLKPVDPKDPSKGYIPPSPENIEEDTRIPYKLVKRGTVIVHYEDTAGNVLKTPVTDENNVPVGTDYNTTDEGDKPTKLTHDGENYVLVPSKTRGTEEGKVVEGTTEVTYVYQKVANWIPLIPGEPNPPKTPYPFDPTKPEDPIPTDPKVPGVPVIPYVPGYEPEIPLQPVDPEDPTKGYIPPTPETPGKDTPIPYVPAKGTVIVKYRDVDGNPLKDPVTDEDNVPVGTEYNTTDEGDKPTTLVHDGENYVLVPSLTEGTEEGKVTKGTTTITYVYQKVGNWIPLIPGEPNPPKTPYPFNPEKPNDPIPAVPEVPGKPGVPVIPYVPGYEPEIPLQPVDPEDPTKGYIPPTPETPGKDTPIPYKPANGTVVIEYKDVDGNVIKTPVRDEDNVPVGTVYNTTDEGDKPTTIVHDGETYVLVPSLTEGTEEGKVTKGTTTITYVYQKVANWIPELPAVPDKDRPRTPYPFDPAKPGDPIPAVPEVPGKPGVPVIPHVPGYEPVDPSNPTDPLKPVDPKDPNKGYIPPVPEIPGKDTRIPYVPAYGTVVIEYKDVNGKPIKSPVTDENNVRVDTPYNTTDEGDRPTTIITENGDKYVLVPSLTQGEEEGKVTKGTTTITYVYQKVANWIPELPGVPEKDRPKTPYPFNPEKPNDPIPGIPTNPETGIPVIPYVPGYEPFDPTDPTKPLQPVDPEDPSKGYIPPVPTTPGEDTLIPYRPVPGQPVPPTTGVEIPENPTPEKPVEPGKPTPEKPEVPGEPTPEKPAEPGKSTPAKPAKPGKPKLSNTGEAADSGVLAGLGLLGFVSVLARRRKNNK